MGRWAQYRKRGSTREPVQPTQPPTAEQWTWAQAVADPGNAAFALLAFLPAGAIGWQVWYWRESDDPAYLDQGFGAPVSLDEPIVPVAEGEEFNAYVRYILNGGGLGDPDSTYSDFSDVKTFTYHV